MPNQTRVVSPGPRGETVLTTSGEILAPPADWSLLLPGDPGLTRRVKAAGPSWTVQEKRGRKTFSQGVWAPQANIAAAMKQLEVERSTDAYSKRQAEQSRQLLRQYRDGIAVQPGKCELRSALAKKHV